MASQKPQKAANTRQIYTSAQEGSSDRQVRFTVCGLEGAEPVPSVRRCLLVLGPTGTEDTISLGERAARGEEMRTEATLLMLDRASHHRPEVRLA